jgi:hypothetical protein
MNSLRRPYQADPIDGQPDPSQQDHIGQIGPIDDHAGIAHIAPSNIEAGIVHTAPGNVAGSGDIIPYGLTNVEPRSITNIADIAQEARGVITPSLNKLSPRNRV